MINLTARWVVYVIIGAGVPQPMENSPSFSTAARCFEALPEIAAKLPRGVDVVGCRSHGFTLPEEKK